MVQGQFSVQAESSEPSRAVLHLYAIIHPVSPLSQGQACVQPSIPQSEKELLSALSTPPWQPASPSLLHLGAPRALNAKATNQLQDRISRLLRRHRVSWNLSQTHGTKAHVAASSQGDLCSQKPWAGREGILGRGSLPSSVTPSFHSS